MPSEHPCLRYSGVEKEAFLRTYLGGRRLVDLDKFALVTAVNLLQCIRSSDTQHYNRSTVVTHA